MDAQTNQKLGEPNFISSILYQNFSKYFYLKLIE